MKFLRGLLLAAVVFFASSSFGAEVQDSVGALYNRAFDNSLRFTCTVTAIEKESGFTTLLTAAHCVSELQKYYLVTFDNQVFYNAVLYKIPRKHPDDPKDVDMALLRAKDLQVPVLSLADSKDVKTGSDIATVGFPLGVAKLLYKGYLAGRVDNLSSELHSYLVLQIFGAPGSSGTSVIDKSSGKVIGVLVGASTSMGTPVLYATPSEYRKYLVTPGEKRKVQRDHR